MNAYVVGDHYTAPWEFPITKKYMDQGANYMQALQGALKEEGKAATVKICCNLSSRKHKCQRLDGSVMKVSFCGHMLVIRTSRIRQNRYVVLYLLCDSDADIAVSCRSSSG